MTTAHQHTGKKQHRQALSTTCCTEIRSPFTVALQIDVRMFQDIFVEAMSSEELRIAAHNLSFTLRGVGKKHEVLHYT